MAINPNNGVLDIINGTLKVSSIDIKQAGGFTTAINTIARNDVLLYDDQDTNTTFTPTQNAGYSSSSGVTRDTTAIDFNDGWVYWPLQLPNSWHTEFDILIPTTGGVLTYSLFNTSEPNHTDYTANDGGYKIVFDNTQNQIDIRWEGSVHATTSANVRSADWQHVNINYFQGAVSISLAGKVVLTHKFTENYQEFDSRYVGFSATSGASHKIRHLIVHNSDKWLYTKTSNASDISYVSGNVGIGSLSPTELLDVHGNVHIAKDLTVDGNLTVSGTTTFIDTQNLAIEDPIIEVARGNASDTIDAGLVITRASSNVAVAYRGDEEELALGYTQSGASDTDVTPIADGGLSVRVYGNLFANNLTTTANVEATYLKGNGSEITHVTLDQVVDYGNTTANTIHLTNTDVGLKADGNIEANYFIGNGSQLDGISSTLQEITDNGNVTTNTIQFTNTTTALVADSNVGIGTDAPSANLHVVGHQYVNDPPTVANSFDHSDAPLTLTHGTPTSTTAIDDPKPVLHLTRDGTSGEAYGARASFNLSRYENSGTASRSRLDVALTDGTYAESNVMSIRADGKVGIGTTAPGYTLDVDGDINLSGDFYQGGSPFVSSLWTDSQDSLYYRSNVEVGTANLFVDTTTSRVGIGTTAPGYTLDVHGSSNVGALTATSISGPLSGNADTATALETARTIGGVSFDGTTNINLPGVNTTGNQNTSGNAATATALETARTIGGVSFDGTTNINLPGVNTTGNQDTTGNAATATALETARTINGVSFNGSANITVEPYISNDDTGDTNCPIVFTANSTAGYKRLYEDSTLYFNNTNNILYSPTFSGSLSGNADTATALETARTINGVSFDGSANITVNGLNYNVNNSWLRENGDDANFKQYGSARQMVFRTDGTTEYASGVGGYPFAWMYGGDASSNRRMLLNTSGQLWCSNYGWLHDKFMARAQVFTDNNSDVSFTGQTIDFNGSGSQTNTANRTHKAFFIDYDTTASGGTATANERNYHYAMHSDMRHSGTSQPYAFYTHLLYTRSDHTTGTCSNMRGVDNTVVSSGTGINTAIWGINTYVIKDAGSSGATTTIYGTKTEVEVDAGTVTNAYAYHAHIDRDAGTLTNGYLYYGSYAGTVTTKWGVYITGESKNYFSGNVGIGTTSPGYKLDVSGTLHAGNSYFDNVYIGGSTSRGLRAVSGNYGTVQTTGGGAGNWEGYSIDGRYVFMSENNNSCGIYNDLDNEWMVYCYRNTWVRLYYNGATKLETNNGGITVTGTVTATTFSGNATTATSLSGGTAVIGTNPSHDDNFDYSDIPLQAHYNSTATSNTTLNDPKSVMMLTREGTASEAYGAGAAFQLSRWENNATNSRCRLDIALTDGTFDLTSIMTMRSNGNVGIGETSPSYKLDVNGETRVGNVLYIGKNTDDETAKTIYFGGTSGDNSYNHCVIERRVWSAGTEKQELLLFSGNDGETGSGPDRIRLKGAQILFDTLNDSTDRTTENTKMIIRADGKVGIGTTSPAQKLHVTDHIHVHQADTGVATLSAYGDSQGTGRLYVGQSSAYGGGIEYNGDNSPASTGAGADFITLYRVDNGTYNWTARNLYNSNNWEFRGTVTAPTFSGNATSATTATNQSGGSVSATTGAFSQAMYYNEWIRNNGTSASGLYWHNASNPGYKWHIYPENQSDMTFRVGAGNGGIKGTTAEGTVRGYIHWTTSNEIGFLNNGRGWSLRMDSGNNCQVYGSILANGNVTAYSDIRHKEDLNKIDNPLEKIDKLNGYTYTSKRDGKRYTGLVAQEVLEVLPEAIEEKEDGYALAYGNMAGLFVEAMKDMTKQLQTEKAKVETLETQLASVLARVDALEGA